MEPLYVSGGNREFTLKVNQATTITPVSSVSWKVVLTDGKYLAYGSASLQTNLSD